MCHRKNAWLQLIQCTGLRVDHGYKHIERIPQSHTVSSSTSRRVLVHFVPSPSVRHAQVGGDTIPSMCKFQVIYPNICTHSTIRGYQPPMEAPAQSVSSCLTGRKRRSLPWARPVVQVAFDGDQLWKLVWLGWPTRPLSRMIYRCGPQGSKDTLSSCSTPTSVGGSLFSIQIWRRGRLLYLVDCLERDIV